MVLEGATTARCPRRYSVCLSVASKISANEPVIRFGGARETGEIRCSGKTGAVALTSVSCVSHRSAEDSLRLDE
jgi:hypothetical protein